MDVSVDWNVPVVSCGVVDSNGLGIVVFVV